MLHRADVERKFQNSYINSSYIFPRNERINEGKEEEVSADDLCINKKLIQSRLVFINI